MLDQGFLRLCAERFNMRNVMALVCLIFLTACAGMPVQRPTPPFSAQQVFHILSKIKEQQNKADRLFSTGKLIIKGEEDPESESDILIVGSRSPFRVKIEVTHPWGRPILHILADETRLHVLSFTERRYYFGSLDNSYSSRLFGKSLTHDQLWSLVRAFPILKKSEQAVSHRGNQIKLLNENAESVQIIDLFPQSHLPRRISFPERNLKISFSDYQKENDICYAREIGLIEPGAAGNLFIKLKRTVFNKPIPEAIFSIKKPADFKTLPLK